MNNASRALTIASEVLIGLLVLGVGIYFLRALSDFGNTTVFRSNEQREIIDFNKPFTDLINKIERNPDPDENPLNGPNVGDVISVMNYARDVNLEKFDEYRAEIIAGRTPSPENTFVKLRIKEGVSPERPLEDFYKKEKGYLAKYNDEMFKIIEKYSVQVDLTNPSGGIDPTIKPFKVEVKDVKKDSAGMIRELKIEFSKD